MNSDIFFCPPTSKEIAAVKTSMEDNTLSITTDNQKVLQFLQARLDCIIQNAKWHIEEEEKERKHREEEDAKRKRDNELYGEEAVSSINWIKENENLNPDSHMIFPKSWAPWRRSFYQFMQRTDTIKTVLLTENGDIYGSMTDAAKDLGLNYNTLHHLKENTPKKVTTADGKEIAIVKLDKWEILIGHRYDCFHNYKGDIYIDQIRGRRQMFENYQNQVNNLKEFSAE